MNTAAALLRSLRRRDIALSAYRHVISSSKASCTSSYIHRPRPFSTRPPNNNYNKDVVVSNYVPFGNPSEMDAAAIRIKGNRVELPLSLGIESSGGIFTTLMSKGTTLPATTTKVFSARDVEQSEVGIKVYQGEGTMAAYNKLLGEMEIEIKPYQRISPPRIEVKFEVDEKGLVTVYAKDTATGRERVIAVPSPDTDTNELVAVEDDDSMSSFQVFLMLTTMIYCMSVVGLGTFITICEVLRYFGVIN